MTTKINSWKEVWQASPGPESRKDYYLLMLKGFCMGSADIIPGVSGGTIAFITGIYTKLLAAIASVDLTVFQKLLKLEIKEALAGVHLRFLVTLLVGILVAVFSIARLMHYLISNHAVLTWSLFFGLIVASIIIVGKSIQSWNGSSFLWAAVGAVAAFFIVGLIPVETPNTWWFLIFCGMIAISALLLPGLSGSFILLILGKYEFVTGAVKNPFLVENIITILVFLVGCIIGVMGFSRILKYFLNNYYNPTMALLTGIMIGALRKVWPWKEVIETKVIRGKVHVLQEANIFPPQMETQVFLAIGLAVIGFTFVMLLENYSSREK